MKQVMDRIILISLVLCFGSIAIAKVSIKEDNTKAIYQFQLDTTQIKPITLKSKRFMEARIVGAKGYEGVYYKIGHPEIPTIQFYVQGQAKVEYQKSRSIHREKSGLKLKPSQKPHPKRPGVKLALAFDKKAYERNQVIPKKVFEIKDAGSIRGMKRSLVVLYPLQYNPVTNEYYQIDTFKVTVKKSIQKSKAVSPKETFAFVVGQQFASSPSLSKYVAFKEKLGFHVETIVVGDQITTADDIRSALQSLYADQTTGLKYVLIIGDAEDVPGYSSTIISGMTDHYYRAIDTADYMSDINGPDVGVGRISVKDEAQLTAVIDKYMRYQRGTFKSQSFLESASFIATNDQYTVAEGSHNYAIDTYTKAEGYTGVFPNTVEAGGDKLYAITHNVSDEKVVETIKLGRTIINYSGHGGVGYWAGPVVNPEDVEAINHESALPFVISNACDTGQFISESFGETWQRHPYGAIMFWGSMDSSYWDEDDILEKAMYDGIYRDGFYRFSDITQYALSEVWAFYQGEGRSEYYWETYVTFGDPSVRLRTHTTKTLQLEGPAIISMGTNGMRYQVSDSRGNPLAGVRVALSNPTISAVEYSDNNGGVEFDDAELFIKPGKLDVVAYGDNSVLYEGTVEVVAQNIPYLKLHNFTLNGRPGTELYLGETVDLGLTVKNIGQAEAMGATLSIEELTGPAEVIDDEISVPSLQVNGEHAISNGGLRFDVDTDAELGESVTMKLKWSLDKNTSGTYTVNMVISKAQLSIVDVDFGDPSSESGGINPGNQGKIFLTLKNVGTEKIKDAQLNVYSNHSCIGSISGQLNISRLDPGKTVRLDQPIQVSITQACSNGTDVDFGFNGQYQSLSQNVSLESMGSFIAGFLSLTHWEEMDIALEIPDDGDFVEKTFEVVEDVKIDDLAVHVKITHTYIGDLVVVLVHPDGTRATLHDQEGGGSDNIDTVYGMDGEPVADLANFFGKSSKGTWKIQARDNNFYDKGTLDYLKLSIKGYLD